MKQKEWFIGNDIAVRTSKVQLVDGLRGNVVLSDGHPYNIGPDGAKELIGVLSGRKADKSKQVPNKKAGKDPEEEHGWSVPAGPTPEALKKLAKKFKSKKRGYRFVSEEDKKSWLESAKNGWTPVEIAKKAGRCYSTVLRTIHRAEKAELADAACKGGERDVATPPGHDFVELQFEGFDQQLKAIEAAGFETNTVEATNVG